MYKKRLVLASTLASAMALSLIAAPVLAQTWPTRPVMLVVPYAAGGPVDVVARLMAARVSELLGQQLVIENIGGAGGMAGAAKVAKAAPDGYTVLASGSAVLANVPLMYKKPLYNPLTDFEHAALFSDSARVLIVPKDFPASTLPEFIAYSKANQAKMQYGSSGGGSGMHICAVLLNQAMDADITHVPYRGASFAMQDLLAGRIDYITEQISTALPQIEGKTVKAITTLGPERAPGLEKLPTADEAGVNGLDCGSWGSFSFPRGTPAAIVNRLAKASSDAIDTPALRDRFLSIGVTVTAPARRSPEYMTKFVASEIARWTPPIKASGVVLD